MRDPSFYVSGLLELHEVTDATERRARWRQSLAALAKGAAEEGPGPLDGVHPDALAKGVRAALASQLVDDLDWLDPAAAGVALYELASALPIGPEQRDLGRRVLARLLESNAGAFVALATRMALSSATGKSLASPAVRARVALVTELPIGLGLGDERLALAIASRRDMARGWIAEGSKGSLAARRLSARLIERAAREAAKRAARGDSHALRVFSSDAVKEAWGRLLGDRESLVWRHVAVARGLLAPWVDDLRVQIAGALSPELTPTEWRRGATSVAAMVAVAPEAAMRVATGGLGQGVLRRDPGAASAFVWGLPRAAEAEPEAATELLGAVLSLATPDVAEAIFELRAELGAGPFVERAFARGLAMLEDRAAPSAGPSSVAGGVGGGDDGAFALVRELTRDLGGAAGQEPREDLAVHAQLTRAMLLYATDGARAAYQEARKVLAALGAQMDTLEAVSREDDAGSTARSSSMARRASFAALRDLDTTLLERTVVGSLLHLGGSGAEAMRQHDETLDTVRERLSEWLLARESTPLPPSGQVVYVGGEARPSAVMPSHPTLRLRRLRALLHLVDGDVEDDSDAARAARLRRRWLRTAKALLGRFENDPPSILRRTILAALARALDALARAGACDVSDVLLVVAQKVTDPIELDTLAEASMAPDLVHVLQRYADFVRGASTPGMASRTKLHDSLLPPSVPLSIAMPSLLSKLAALEALSEELSPDASTRTEALRTVLVRLHSAMSIVVGSSSVSQLASSGEPGSGDPDVVAELESTLHLLAQLAAGARARLDPDRASSPPPGASERPLALAVSRVLSGAEPALGEHVLSECVDDLVGGVPLAIASIASGVIWGIADLPVEHSSNESTSMRRIEVHLPAWVPTRRTIGDFYVQKMLGGGSSHSSFLVTRAEERGDPDAERFVLKVPDYSATAARVISEAEFTSLFRREAPALADIPPHANLAHVVTLDVDAKPKPILVMEFVEGPTLERLIASRALGTERSLRVLDDVLAGLAAMHEVGIAHLDLQPANVVLRRPHEDAVLVDFGLAGRHLRPGCAPVAYGAPEVWGSEPVLSPLPADVYAFGCVAYETLTGEALFDAESDLAQIALHAAHDGQPARVRALMDRPDTMAVGELLRSTLRRDPGKRATVKELRERLRALRSALVTSKWPLST